MKEGFQVFSAEKLTWHDGPASLPPGCKIALLEGDPNRDGPFVFRVKVPDGYRIPTHTHPKWERVTVISGTFYINMDDSHAGNTTTEMRAGSYGHWPPGMQHTVWAKGETVLQFHGMGPWSITYVNPKDDPRNQKKGPSR